MDNSLVESPQNADHATHLAVPVTGSATHAASGGQFLIFGLQDEVYGLDILCVREIIGYTRPASIPMMPSFVHGVIDLRGNVVPIIDLALRFDWPATDIRVRTCIVVIDVHGENGTQVIGILVDAVNAVLDLNGLRIEPPPSFGTGLPSEFILGMARIDDAGFITLLDASRVLSVEDMAALAQAGRAGLGHVQNG